MKLSIRQRLQMIVVILERKKNTNKVYIVSSYDTILNSFQIEMKSYLLTSSSFDSSVKSASDLAYLNIIKKTILQKWFKIINKQ